MVVDPKIEDALRTPDPLAAARALAVGMRQEGQEQSAILEFFERSRQALHSAGRESDADILLEVMDFLVGWCSPHMDLERKQV